MKKCVVRIGFAILVLSSVSVLASISVDWFSYGTIYLNDGTTPLPVGSIAQLIWSRDATISPYNPTDALVVDTNEVLLAQVATAAGDDFPIQLGTVQYDEETYSISDTNFFANGYVYVRVFDYLQANGTPTNGTWFVEAAVSGPIYSQHAGGGNPPATAVDITGGSGYSISLNDQVVVPEPTTMAIMGIGLLTLVSRRFRRK